MKLIILLVSAFILMQCKTTAPLTDPTAYEGPSINFGNGGGFSGKVASWTLLGNGQLFKGNGDYGYKQLGRLSDDQTNQIFTSYKTYNFGEIDIDSPGNMYFYLTHTEDGHAHKIQWGSHDAGEPQILSIYYSNLIAMTRKFKPQKGPHKKSIEK